MIFAGLIFILMGVFVLNGVEETTGYTVSQNGSITTIEKNTQTWDDRLKLPFTFTLWLVGLAVLLIGVVGVFSMNDQKLEYSGEDEEE